MGLLKRGGRHSTGKRSCLLLSGLSSKIHKEPPLEPIWLDSSPALNSLQLFSPFPNRGETGKRKNLDISYSPPLFFLMSPSLPAFMGQNPPISWVTLAAQFAPFLISFSFHLKTQCYLSSEKSQKFSRQNCLSEISQLTLEGLRWISFSARGNLTPLFVIPNFLKFLSL